MKTVLQSPIDLRFAKNRYKVKEITEIFRDKLEKDLREKYVDDLGVETVYKCFELEKDTKRQDFNIVDMYVDSIDETLKSSGKKKEDIGYLTTINDNPGRLTPSPGVEVISRMGLNEDIETDNSQGLACSSFSRSLKNSWGYFQGWDGDSVIVSGSNYTDWFLSKFKEIGKVSDRNDLNYFNYFLMFSDTVSSVLAYNPRRHPSGSLISVDLDMMYTLKDNSLDGFKDRIAKLKESDHGFSVDMYVNSKKLREMCCRLSSKNVSRLNEKFPTEYESAKVRNLHTAGRKFLDEVRDACGVKEEEAKINYDVLKNTGNTGSCSSLQLIKESISRDYVKRGEYGHMIDFGWEGADSFLYRRT